LKSYQKIVVLGCFALEMKSPLHLPPILSLLLLAEAAEFVEVVEVVEVAVISISAVDVVCTRSY
jgi:hypothetical protein